MDFRGRMKRRIKQVGLFILIMYAINLRLTDHKKFSVLRHPRYYGDNRTATPRDLRTAIMNLIGIEDLEATDVENYVESGELIDDFEFPLQSHVCGNNIHLIVVVFSKPSNLFERQAVRKTWGSQFRSAALKLVFLVGQTDQATNELISKEHKQHSDIVQSSFLDSYTNLVHKSVAMLQWVRQFCSQANFLLKIDDDVFLYTDILLSTLESVKDEKSFIMGHIYAHSTPFRTKNKWELPYKIYPLSRFPPYADGPAYVVSSDLVPRLHEVSRHKPRMHLEDIYVTGLCAFVAQANHINSCGFSVSYTYYFFWQYLNKCSTITVHGLNTEQMYTFWETPN